MHNKQKKLKIHDFKPNDPLLDILSDQAKYLHKYLDNLGARSIIEEQNYFDRDYLDEFTAFYGKCAQGYENTCRRLLYFSKDLKRSDLRSAANSSHVTCKKLKDSFLGYIIIRPIVSAPLGRTVLKWFSDDKNDMPRVIEPNRKYYSHFLGMDLRVEGVAWQQQDTAVGACATIGLWSMMHASAYDEIHAIPTTAEITLNAHKSASLGARIFPSNGLVIEQICEAIKEQNLSPIPFEGDLKDKDGNTIGISRARFSSICASLIRSAYPVMLIGELGDGRHAVVATGFRSEATKGKIEERIILQDSFIEYLYIHDDNLGPNVRFKISADIKKRTILSPSAPDGVETDGLFDDYDDFIPVQLIVAVHNDLRSTPDSMHRLGLKMTDLLRQLLDIVANVNKKKTMNLAFSTRFFKIHKYIGDELSRVLKGSNALGAARISIAENIPPMSLHIGVIRIGSSGQSSKPIVDITFDTTDSERNHPVFMSVVYNKEVYEMLKLLVSSGVTAFGRLVKAF